MNEGQFYAWCLAAFILLFIFSGGTAIRAIGAVFLWQALTPMRSAIIDIPLLLSFLIIIEVIYRLVADRTKRCPTKKNL